MVVTDSHNSKEWANVVGRIVEEWYADAQRITLVQDNLSAHRKAAFYEVFEPKRAGAPERRAILNKVEFVYTPQLSYHLVN